MRNILKKFPLAHLIFQLYFATYKSEKNAYNILKNPICM